MAPRLASDPLCLAAECLWFVGWHPHCSGHTGKFLTIPEWKLLARLLQQSLANRKPFPFFFFLWGLKKDCNRLRKNSSKMGSIFPKILKMSNDSWAGGTFSPYCLCYCIHHNKAKQNKMKSSKPRAGHLLRTHQPENTGYATTSRWEHAQCSDGQTHPLWLTVAFIYIPFDFSFNF